MTILGRLIQFDSADALLEAVDALRAQGYSRMQAFSPYAVDGLAERLGGDVPSPGRWMFAAGALGAVGTLALQYVSAVLDYPLDVGGRPPASWPAFIPATVEVAILFAVVAGVGVVLRRSGLPALYQPIFDVAWFEEASRTGFLLLVSADDACWDEARTAEHVAELYPLRHSAVET